MVARWLLLCAACSSNKPRAADDAIVPRTDAPVIDAAIDAAVSSANTGDLQVRVEWRDVPVPMRAAPGRTACNTPRAPVVAPTTTWGIPDVFVVVEGATLPQAPARILLADCALTPRVVAGTSAVVESASDRPSKITFAKRGTSFDKIEVGTRRPILLPIAGHAVSLPLEADGIYTLDADGETSWIVASPSAGVTEPNGQLLVKDLAPGKYAVTAWLPQRANGTAKLARGSATVVAGDLAELTLELK